MSSQENEANLNNLISVLRKGKGQLQDKIELYKGNERDLKIKISQMTKQLNQAQSEIVRLKEI